jgi:hypothetical protein
VRAYEERDREDRLKMEESDRVERQAENERMRIDNL